MSFPESIRSFLKKPVALLGFGVSGKGAAALMRDQEIAFTVYDEKGEGESEQTFDSQAARRHDLVVFSPGFPGSHPWLTTAREAGCQTLGEFDFASLFWKGSFVAVTGTNGKTTLTDFLTLALKRSGFSSIAAGNVGYPLSRLFEVRNVPDSVAVCEVSSFQAESLQHFKPDALLWTNIDEDHLDRYDGMCDYFEAKWKLVERLAEPKLVVGKSVKEWAERLGKTLPPFAQVVDREAESATVPANTCFDNYPQRENYLVARRYWELQDYDVSVLEEAAKQFIRAKHRLEKLETLGKATFWNDSKSTNFAAALAALKTFEEPVFWIGGGKKKGGDLQGFAQNLSRQIREAYLIGESAPEMQSYLEQQGIFATTFKSIDDALYSAFERAKERTAIVLSPGFSSQDMFTDYIQRGICFEKAVYSLKQNLMSSSG